MKKQAKSVNLVHFHFSFPFLFLEILLFLLAQVVALILGFRILQIEEIRTIIEKQGISLWNLLLVFLVGTVIILFSLRFIKRAIIFKAFFYFIIIFGLLIFFDMFLPFWLTLFLTFLILFWHHFFPSVLSQNVVVILVTIGVSIYIGLSLSVWQVIILLIILSLYDLVAVHKTRHMVKMFKGLAEKGAIFSLIIPFRFKNLLTRLGQVKPGEEFVFLGTGDLAFPMIFSISALSLGVIHSIFIIGGALFGILAINLFFTLIKKRISLAALPPIALGSIIGYFISLLI